eukprot:jgi/Hompol1/6173/HPOL_004859-RA
MSAGADDNNIINDSDFLDTEIFGQLTDPGLVSVAAAVAVAAVAASQLELDEDETHEFTKELLTNFFAQAHATLASMRQTHFVGDLPALGKLGHFLKV